MRTPARVREIVSMEGTRVKAACATVDGAYGVFLHCRGRKITTTRLDGLGHTHVLSVVDSVGVCVAHTCMAGYFAYGAEDGAIWISSVDGVDTRVIRVGSRTMGSVELLGAGTDSSSVVCAYASGHIGVLKSSHLHAQDWEEIPAKGGGDPVASLCTNAAGTLVGYISGARGDVSILCVSTREVLTRIPLSSTPRTISMSPCGGSVFVSLVEGDALHIQSDGPGWGGYTSDVLCAFGRTCYTIAPTRYGGYAVSMGDDCDIRVDAYIRSAERKSRYAFRPHPRDDLWKQMPELTDIIPVGNGGSVLVVPRGCEVPQAPFTFRLSVPELVRKEEVESIHVCADAMETLGLAKYASILRDVVGRESVK